MTRTLGPWTFSPSHIEEGPSAVRANSGRDVVCTTASDDDAMFIVQSSNAHDECVEVLEACKGFLRDLTDPDRTTSGADIIASYANAISLRLRVVNAIAASKKVLT